MQPTVPVDIQSVLIITMSGDPISRSMISFSQSCCQVENATYIRGENHCPTGCFLAILYLLRFWIPPIHERGSRKFFQSSLDDTALQACLEQGRSRTATVPTGKQAPITLGPVLEDDYIQQWRNGTKPHDMEALSADEVRTYVKEILGASNGTMWRLKCWKSIAVRYNSLQANTENDGRVQYLFAIDLYQSLSVLPTLLGSIVHTIRFLGPKRCAVSFVEGRSTDGTYQVLAALKDELESLGTTFYMSTSDVSPQDGKQDRFAALAFLRNLALAPLVMEQAKFSPDTQIIFLNDIYLCPHDILELLYQQQTQQAAMTCGMDWSHRGAIFYDIYVARSIVGETFWQIAQDGGWHFSGNLFWADRQTNAKYLAHEPFQVYACWNGGAVISAKPIMERRIRFRRN